MFYVYRSSHAYIHKLNSQLLISETATLQILTVLKDPQKGTPCFLKLRACLQESPRGPSRKVQGEDEEDAAGLRYSGLGIRG